MLYYRHVFTFNIKLMKSTAAYGLEDVDRRGFVSLMDMYEINFMRFKKLVNTIDTIEGHAIARLSHCLDLHLTIEERCKFTTTATLSYAFDDESGVTYEPNLKLRIYHDAKLIEVVAGHLRHGRLHHDHVPADALRLKWKLNRFLYKWLGFCLYLGYKFDNKPALDDVSHQNENLSILHKL